MKQVRAKTVIGLGPWSEPPKYVVTEEIVGTYGIICAMKQFFIESFNLKIAV